MKKRIISFVKKQWLLLWVIMLSVVLFGVSAFADYPSALSSMKRVVASTSDLGTKFSSNILIENGETTYSPAYFDKTDSSTYDVGVYLWNYSAKDPLDWYRNTINYTLSFQLTDKQGTALSAGDLNARNSVQIYKGNSPLMDGSDPVVLSSSKLSYTLTESLAGAYSDSDMYTLKYNSNWDLDNDEDICVKVIAEPTPASSYKDIFKLAAIIGMKETPIPQSVGWRAYLSEHISSEDARGVQYYDGYNLVLSGSGKADIVITWDSSKIELNKYFYDGTYSVYTFADDNKEIVLPITESGTLKTLVIHADTGSTETNHSRSNRYNIQVYKIGEDFDPSDWSFFAVKNGTNADANWNSASSYLKVEIQQNNT